MLGTFQEAPEIARRDVIDEVFFMPRRLSLDELQPILLACDEMGVVSHVNFRLFEEINARVEAREIQGRPFLTLTAAPRSGV